MIYLELDGVIESVKELIDLSGYIIPNDFDVQYIQEPTLYRVTANGHVLEVEVSGNTLFSAENDILRDLIRYADLKRSGKPDYVAAASALMEGIEMEREKKRMKRA